MEASQSRKPGQQTGGPFVFEYGQNSDKTLTLLANSLGNRAMNRTCSTYIFVARKS